MKNLENVKALNDMEMAKVAGGLYWIPENTTGCFLEKANGRFLLKPPMASDEAHLTRRGKC